MLEGLKTEENRVFFSKLAKFAPPVIFAELLSALVNIMDTVMIGRAMGSAEITAVALANQIFFVYVVIFWGIVGGCGVFIGQYFGKGEKENIPKVVGLGLTGAMIVCALFFVPSFFFPHVLIGLFSQSEYVIELGAGYLRTLSFSYFFVAITFTRNGCMRNTGQAKVPMITTSVALILNFVLNYVFIFVLDAPLYIIAVGTVIARGVELALQQIFIVKLNIPIRGTFKQYFSYTWSFVKEFVKVTSFIFLGLVTWSVGTAIYNVAYAHAGYEAQASIKIATSMLQLFQVFGISLGVATQIIMTQTLGSGDKRLAVAYSRKCFAFATSVSVIMTLLLMLFAPVIVWIFDPEPHIIHHVTMLTYVYALSMVLRTGNFVNLNGILRSGGDTKFHFFVDLISVWAIGIPMAFLGVVFLGLPIYWAVLLVHADELFKFIVSIVRVRSNKWARQLV